MITTATWQPIETAPKDRRILVWTGQERYAAHWGINAETGETAWIVAGLANGERCIVQATHWTELPDEPPAQP